MNIDRGIIAAIAAALLFGLSTPLAKTLVGDMAPLLLAGLLYLGSGLGLAVLLMVRAGLGGLAGFSWPRGRELLWLLGAIIAGGAVGPFLLMSGLRLTDAASASLILNLEAVFTALLAWFVFKENFDRRIALGMALIVAGGAVLAAGPALGRGGLLGPMAIAGACLAWAIDNNLTRKVSLHDAMAIACAKGLVAGVVNTLLALGLGASLPTAPSMLKAGALGFVGYGLSLTLFVLALRHLGSSRTGAYFSIAPFFGAALAVVLGAPLSAAVTVAALLMAAGVWLHLTERHRHEHQHQELDHEHDHVHDAHHQHAHDDPATPGISHRHQHRHLPLSHTHAHFPDAHHRHRH
jgi:drug/metabolite transporter (DMT)-like permease